MRTHPRRSASADSSVYRLFDVYTVGDEIYLVSSTSLIDGAEALGCAVEFCGMRPVTGQVSSPIPFPAVDVLNFGWTYTSSPIANTRLSPSSWYGLDSVQLVIANRGVIDQGSSDLLKDFWRGTATEWVWRLRGERSILDQLLPERVREVHIYDVDGTVVRFLGRKRADGLWEYHPAFGVFSCLESDDNGFFTLYGGAPGNMRAKGGWQYTFGPLMEDDGDVMRFYASHAPLVRATDPLGISVFVLQGDGFRAIYDPISGSTLSITGDSMQWLNSARNPEPQVVMEFVSRGQRFIIPSTLLPTGEDWLRSVQERVHYEHLSATPGSVTIRVYNMWSGTASGAPAIEQNLAWGNAPQGEQDLIRQAFQSNMHSNFVASRLISRSWGNLIPYTYTYEWIDPLRFRITTERDALQTKLTYLTDESTGKFVEATYERPSLAASGATERFVYRFNQVNGQVDLIRFFANAGSSQPKWEIEHTFANPNDPLAITKTEQRYPAEGITRTWRFGYTERNGETLLQSVHDPTGVSAYAEYEHFDYPVLPSAIIDGANHRWEMTYTGPGLLQTFKEPDRNPWTLNYYPPGHPFQNKLQQITDPTGRSVKISQYDLFGRPSRVEVEPSTDRLLWQEIDWTMLGAPRIIRWSDDTQVDFYWQGPGLRGVRDARGRTVWFDYNLQQELGAAGLLNQIRIGGTWDNLNSGQRFARLLYDQRGRLTRVEGGNGIGVNYGYGLRDQLRSVRYDGDSNTEEFTYSCCGELESWRKPDGQHIYFEYEGGLLKHIRLNNPNNPPSYTFGYDLAGRLKSVQSSSSTHQWIYEYEVGANTGRLAQEQTMLYGAGISYTHAYTYYPSGEVETSTLSLSTTQGEWQRTLRYVYDDAGRLTNIYYNNQLLASYSYDNAGRLQSQTIRPLGSSHQLTTTLTYADAQSVGALGAVEWRWNNQLLASFDYDGYDGQPGYYPDGALARAIDTLPGVDPIRWEWDYDALGQLAYEKRRKGNEEWQQTTFTYDLGGNLWGNAGWVYRFNQLLYVPRTEVNNNWYFAYTPNGERERWWTTDRGEALQGDVNRDGQVDDSDLLAVQFAFGRTDCPCPEDLNGDGQVDDADLLMVLFNFGQSAGGVVSWEYAYDIWGNLVQAASPAAGVYRAGYDALGRRIWEEVQTAQGTRRTYYLYEGDTIIGEVSPEGMYEYVWGLLGPIARIDLNNPADTRYYVIDGLGHVRALVNSQGVPTDLYHYDSWGNPLPTGTETTRQPYRWNGAYGYEYIPATGLYHVGAREYDPRTGRWLQRDPIGVAGGHPNVYLYCFNSPLIWKDPSGLQFVVFVHGTLSSPSVFDKSYISVVKQTLGATAGHHLFDWSGGIETYHPSTICAAGRRLAQKLKEIREKFPNEPIYIVAHSNGGNVAIAAAQAGGPVDAIIRLGSPYYIRAGLIDVPDGVRVIDFYDRKDSVQFGSANEFGGAALLHQIPRDWSSRKEWQGWCRYEISVEEITGQAPLKGYEIHSLMRSLEVWNAISGTILRNLP